MNFAERNYHNFECPINEILLKSGIMQMAMRFFFQSLNIFDGSVDELKKFLDACHDSATCVFDFNFSTSDEQTAAKSCLLSAYNLAGNEAVSSDESPSFIFNIDPVLKTMWKAHSEFITKFITRVIQIYDSNFHGICGWSLKRSDKREAQMIGVGCYSFASLINHSCAPNVNRYYLYDKMMVVVDRPIKRGEQLFDCYRSPFFRQSKPERQYSLLSEYAFRCQCEACTNNYPLFHCLKSSDKKLLKWAKKCKNEVSKLNHSEAERKIVDFCAFIQDHAKEFPTAEIVLLQECIQQCVSIILKPSTLFP
jgi:hypothetical protein